MTSAADSLDWRRRPLFWLALAVGSVLAVWRPDFTAADDVSRLIQDPPAPAYIAGIIDSEIEIRENDYGQESVSFVLSIQRYWKNAADPGRDASGRLRVTMPRPKELEYGDQIALSGTLAPPRGLRNPGGFDQRAWLRRQGIRSLFFAGKDDRFKILERGRGNPVLGSVLRFKLACLELLRRDYSERDAAVLSALFFGVRSEIDDAVKSRFVRTGTLHLLAVSGFNVGFVIGIVLLLLKPFHVRRPIALAAGLAAAWLYVLIVGPQSPVFRAGVMATVWLSGEILGRRSDPLNSLGLSALIVWAVRPLELFDPGFQLSYAAVIGIVVAVPNLVRRPELLPNETITLAGKALYETKLLFWTSFAAQAATLPIAVAHFYVVTPWSVFANVPAGALVLVLFMAGAAQMLVSAMVPAAGAWLAWAVQGLLAALLGILSVFERLPLALWTTGRLSLWLWLPLAAASAFFIFYPKKSAAFRAAALLFSAVACFAVQDGLRALDRSFRVTFLDVGQGDAIHLRFPDGTNWLVDAGKGSAPDMGRAVLIPYFRHEGVRRLDSVVITHPQEDHLGGLESLLEEMPVGEYVDPGAPYVSGRYRKLLADLKARRVPRVAVKAGEEARFEGGIRTTVLSAGMPPDAKNINDASIVLKIDHPAGTLVLTGDAGEAAFARINASAPKIHADLLKVPHHGAKPGPEARAFLAASAPSAAVISVGERNRYGHPSAEALAALKAVPGSRVYRTDRSGAVRALFGPGGIRILDGPEAFA